MKQRSFFPLLISLWASFASAQPISNIAPSSEELLADWDKDQVYAFYDQDNDGDGIPDIWELGDKTVFETQPQTFLPLRDDDNDGVPNYRDTDLVACEDWDADGACDLIPSVMDVDFDGVPNFLDLDSDNDGIPDVIEAGNTDVNGDGRADILEDLDLNGWADAYQYSVNSASWYWDIDKDDVPNIFDLDSDSDGVPDVIEAGGTDTNGDGEADDFRDLDGDGWNDRLDGDIGNMIYESEEFSASWASALVRTQEDHNQDGRTDGFLTADADQDGVPNFWDTDSNNNAISDTQEAGCLRIALLGYDLDKDGWADAVDGHILTPESRRFRIYTPETEQALVLTGMDEDANGRPDSYQHADINENQVLDLWELTSKI